MSLEGEKRRKMKCSRCHRFGHTRANRKCPLFDPEAGIEDHEEIAYDRDSDGNVIIGYSSDDVIDTSTIEVEDEEEFEEVILTTIIVDDENGDEQLETQNQCNTS